MASKSASLTGALRCNGDDGIALMTLAWLPPCDALWKKAGVEELRGGAEEIRGNVEEGWELPIKQVASGSLSFLRRFRPPGCAVAIVRTIDQLRRCSVTKRMRPEGNVGAKTCGAFSSVSVGYRAFFNTG